MKQKKIFIGNCDYSLDDNTLKEFIESNDVRVNTVQIVKDRYTDRSRGFGFAELVDTEDLDGAIEKLNGKELSGRALTVNIAKEQKERRPSGRFDNSRGGGGNRKDRKPRW